MPLGLKVHEASYGRKPHMFLFEKVMKIKKGWNAKKKVLWLNIECKQTTQHVKIGSYACYERERHYPGMNKTGVSLPQLLSIGTSSCRRNWEEQTSCTAGFYLWCQLEWSWPEAHGQLKWFKICSESVLLCSQYHNGSSPVTEGNST